MARPNGAPERVAITLLLGLVVSVIVAFVFAPILTVAWCADADVGGTSVCGSEQQSFLGAATPWWLWIAMQLAVVVATVLIARSRVRTA